MRKFLILLALMFVITLCGCDINEQDVNSNFAISLPTVSSEETANGYKNPTSTSSNKTTTSTNASNVTSNVNSSTSPSLSQKYFGSKNSTVYHIPDCSSAKKIKEENLIIFESISEAVSEGYRPCSRCLKDWQIYYILIK